MAMHSSGLFEISESKQRFIGSDFSVHWNRNNGEIKNIKNFKKRIVRIDYVLKILFSKEQTS
ncbi:hypothetical protein AO498_04025 [Algoriphagus sanaruensis]|uniref:Uncharacterized protein n=1 Tax=Algoriphagus sanaruensis TaxID=1727163 RepID=A0A142EKA4_9BACT|nr:hypothetical protein AO498_04025 [Algoriphagus sanaruensis]